MNKEEEKLYTMRMLETVTIGDDFEVTRVPGGWIFRKETHHFKHANPYAGSESMVFVPNKKDM